MLKEIQKEIEDLRIKVYAGQSLEDTEKALYEIEQMLFKAMDKQLNIPNVSGMLFAFWMFIKNGDDQGTPKEEIKEGIEMFLANYYR